MDPKTILFDLQTELSGELLSDIVEVRGRQFCLRLLNEEETSWAFSNMNNNSDLSLVMSARIATLAIGIKSINGEPIEALIKGAFDELEKDDREDILARNSGREDFASYELFMNYLKEQPPSFVNELNSHWQALEKRRDAATGELKNSSGEASETEEKKSTTESSPVGENLQLDIE